MVSDLHHLRATWKDANSARSNFFFKALKADEITSYYGTGFMTTSKRPSDAWNWSGL